MLLKTDAFQNQIEFLGLWEQLNNPAFKGVEFDSFYLKLVVTHLHCPLPNGLKPQTQKV